MVFISLRQVHHNHLFKFFLWIKCAFDFLGPHRIIFLFKYYMSSLPWKKMNEMKWALLEVNQPTWPTFIFNVDFSIFRTKQTTSVVISECLPKENMHTPITTMETLVSTKNCMIVDWCYFAPDIWCFPFLLFVSACTVLVVICEVCLVFKHVRILLLLFIAFIFGSCNKQTTNASLRCAWGFRNGLFSGLHVKIT